MILYYMCGNNDSNEMAQLKEGNFPQVSERDHSELLEIAFSMMVSDPKNRATPEKIIKRLAGFITKTSQETINETSDGNILNHAPDETVARLTDAIPDLLTAESRAVLNS